MNHRMRRIVESLACERRYKIADDKGAEYSGEGSTYKETGADTLHNFKSVAERIGGTPEQVLMTYLLKHIDSINTAVKEAAQCKLDPADHYYRPDPREVYAKGEGIVSRLDDARNYLDLLECLLIDHGHIADPQEWDERHYTPEGWAARNTLQDEVTKAIMKINRYTPVIGVPHDPEPQTAAEAGHGAFYDDDLDAIFEEHAAEIFGGEGPINAGDPSYFTAPEDGSESELEMLRRLPDTQPTRYAELTSHHGAVTPDTRPTYDPKLHSTDVPTEIRGHDGVLRPRSAPEGTPIIPPLCWGDTGE